MKAIRRFTVRSVLPEALSAVGELAANLRWSWHAPTTALFARIDPTLWETLDRDPLAVLGAVDAARLDELAHDAGFVADAEALRADLQHYLEQPRWYQTLADAPARIAYFSPEFGIAAAIPQYSGGLGILAGDHLKSASDLGVPLIGVGLFYRSGYFQQAIDPDGWQRESYPRIDPEGLPMQPLREHDGSAVRVTLSMPDGDALHARVWLMSVGRVALLLLDSDLPDNSVTMRGVTDRLYGGGGEHRLRQELLLGIGGVRALKRYVAISGTPMPEVFHTNEGHAGFLGLERMSDLVAGGLAFDEALQVVRAGTVFTTHTPVPAGIDRFDAALVDRHVSADLLPGIAAADVLPLGAEHENEGGSTVFNMALMGVRLAQRANGVSRLHGEVSRRMFGALWPGFDADDVPITSVTNGVHAPTWTDPHLREISSATVSDAELWAARRSMRAQLVSEVRTRMTAAWAEQNPGIVAPPWVDELLDPDVLTIGFARRVPTYKRLTLMLHDPERLRALLTHPDRPVQLVVAGKSHPADDSGKVLIQRLVRFAAEPDLRRRIVFLPNYDIGMAQRLYPGTDVWLNNPVRPLEACGTSGMKAALNGSLNLSILDGWWNEYYDGQNGWAIPSADATVDEAERDRLEAEALYEILEQQVAPRFYDRDAEGLPRRWLQSIRHSLGTLTPELSSDRMVREYVERLYAPAAHASRAITSDDHRPARALAAWKAHVAREWPTVAVVHVGSGGSSSPRVGDAIEVRAHVQLAGLTADDVLVELVIGRVGAGDDLVDVRRVPLAAVAHEPGHPATFTGTAPLERAGAVGYTVRVTPHHPLLASPVELGLVAVAG